MKVDEDMRKNNREISKKANNILFALKKSVSIFK